MNPSDFDPKGTPEEIIARLTMYASIGDRRQYIGPTITPNAIEAGEAMLQADIRWLLKYAELDPKTDPKP